MNIIEKSVICGYGWQANWRGSCGAVRDVIRGPFHCPRVVGSIPYAVLHCLCESEKKCCGCGAKCRQYSCSPCAPPCGQTRDQTCALPCMPTGCAVGHPFAGYRAANIGMGIPDPFSENIICCPAVARDEGKSNNENEVASQDLVSADACVKKTSVSPAQGIPDPWLCWPKTCATIAAMAPKPCPVHRPRPRSTPRPSARTRRPGFCGSLKKFLRCRSCGNRSRKPRRNWFLCRRNGHRDARCCCCCRCCCCHESRVHCSRRCCSHEDGGHSQRRPTFEERHPLNQLRSYRVDNGNDVTYPPIGNSKPEPAKYQPSIVEKNSRDDRSEERSKSLSGQVSVTSYKRQSKPKTKSQTQTTAETQTQIQAQTQTQTQARTQTQTQAKTQTQTQAKTQAQIQAQTQAKTQVQTQAKTQTQTQTQPEPQLRSKPQPETQPHPRPKTQPRPRSQSQRKTDLKPHTGKQPIPQSKSHNVRSLSNSQSRSFPTSISPIEDSAVCTPPSEPVSVSQSPKQTVEVSTQCDTYVDENVYGPREQQRHEPKNTEESHSGKDKSMQDARGIRTETWKECMSLTRKAPNSEIQPVTKKEKYTRSMATQTVNCEKDNTVEAKNDRVKENHRSNTAGIIKPEVVMILPNDSQIGFKDKNEMKETVKALWNPSNSSSTESLSTVDRSRPEPESSVSMDGSTSGKTYTCARKKTYPCITRIEQQKPKHLLNDPCFACACKQSSAKMLQASSPTSRTRKSRDCRHSNTLTPDAMEAEVNPYKYSRPMVAYLKNGKDAFSSGVRRPKTVQIHPHVSCQDSGDD